MSLIWNMKQQVLHLQGHQPACYEMALLYDSILSYLWPYFFLSVALSLSLHLILSGGFILFLKDTFHLIGIWSCEHYYNIASWLLTTKW